MMLPLSYAPHQQQQQHQPPPPLAPPPVADSAAASAPDAPSTDNSNKRKASASSSKPPGKRRARAGAGAGAGAEMDPDVPTEDEAGSRFRWTDELHQYFLSCIFELGLDAASPKKVFNKMRENVDFAKTLMDPEVVERLIENDTTAHSTTTTQAPPGCKAFLPAHVKSHLQRFRSNVPHPKQAFMEQVVALMEEAKTKHSAEKQNASAAVLAAPAASKAINPQFHAYPFHVDRPFPDGTHAPVQRPYSAVPPPAAVAVKLPAPPPAPLMASSPAFSAAQLAGELQQVDPSMLLSSSSASLAGLPMHLQQHASYQSAPAHHQQQQQHPSHHYHHQQHQQASYNHYQYPAAAAAAAAASGHHHQHASASAAPPPPAPPPTTTMSAPPAGSIPEIAQKMQIQTELRQQIEQRFQGSLVAPGDLLASTSSSSSLHPHHAHHHSLGNAMTSSQHQLLLAHHAAASSYAPPYGGAANLSPNPGSGGSGSSALANTSTGLEDDNLFEWLDAPDDFFTSTMQEDLG